MPTENRSSNTEMVSVPRELIEQAMQACFDAGYGIPHDALRQLLEQPADQHQGEPVALKCWSCKAEFTLKERADCDGCCWKCGVEIDLEDYAEKFAGEVERLRDEIDGIGGLREKLSDMTHARDLCFDDTKKLRAQLTERDALLREAMKRINVNQNHEFVLAIDAALSASAEPSAAVEIDERASFEYHHRVCDLVRDEDCPEDYRNQSVQDSWEGWQARAALERKP